MDEIDQADSKWRPIKLEGLMIHESMCLKTRYNVKDWAYNFIHYIT